MNRTNLHKSLEACRYYYETRLTPMSGAREQAHAEQKRALVNFYHQLSHMERRLHAMEDELGCPHEYKPWRASAITRKDDDSADDGGDDNSADDNIDPNNADDGNPVDSGGSAGDDHYNPDEPRIPAGSPGAGEWTDGGGDDATGVPVLPSSGLVMDDAGNIYQLPSYSDATAPASWADPDLGNFENHFEKHSDDFDSKSPEDYAAQANQFYNMAQEEKFPTLETNQDWLKIYDPETNTFGTYNPKGQTETFFKPSSPTYFARQTSDVLAKGGRIIEPLPAEEPIVTDTFIP